MISKLTLVAIAICGLAALAAGMPQQEAAPSYESASAYKQPSYSQSYSPSYKGPDGRVKIQVYRGPSKGGYSKGGYDSKGGYGGYGFAPWGYYVQQPADYKTGY
ncbi:uncharacterized protein LOC136038977 [Artemia franciscana]|uniref:Uncharacterized protein n=1 Tax=Artemia franciscana TaxID=6661 RepID=A0AA88HVX3_ARTSF|nr:hypothetical protein QYM36_009856 [Artemia franciscana]